MIDDKTLDLINNILIGAGGALALAALVNLASGQDWTFGLMLGVPMLQGGLWLYLCLTRKQ